MEFPKPHKVGATPKLDTGIVKVAALSPVNRLIAEYVDAGADSMVRIVDYATQTVKGRCLLSESPELMRFSPDGQHLLLLAGEFVHVFGAPWIEPLPEFAHGDWKERLPSANDADPESESTAAQPFFERVQHQSKIRYSHKDATWLSDDSFLIALAGEVKTAVYIVAVDGTMLGYSKLENWQGLA